MVVQGWLQNGLGWSRVCCLSGFSPWPHLVPNFIQRAFFPCLLNTWPLATSMLTMSKPLYMVIPLSSRSLLLDRSTHCHTISTHGCRPTNLALTPLRHNWSGLELNSSSLNVTSHFWPHCTLTTFTSSLRDLNVTLDNTLSFSEHLFHLTRSCYYDLRRLKAIRSVSSSVLTVMPSLAVASTTAIHYLLDFPRYAFPPFSQFWTRQLGSLLISLASPTFSPTWLIFDTGFPLPLVFSTRYCS